MFKFSWISTISRPHFGDGSKSFLTDIDAGRAQGDVLAKAARLFA